MRRARVLVLAGLLACQQSSSSSPPPPRAKIAITGLQPDNATVRGLRICHIVGTGFNQRVPVTVYFGSTPSPRAVVVAPSKIQAEVPPGDANTDVEVRVLMDGYEPAVAPVRFRYLPDPHD